MRKRRRISIHNHRGVVSSSSTGFLKGFTRKTGSKTRRPRVWMGFGDQRTSMTVLLSSVGVSSKTNFSTPQRGRNSRFIRGVPSTADNSGRRGGEITRASETSTSLPNKCTTIHNKAIRTPRGIRNSINIGSCFISDSSRWSTS